MLIDILPQWLLLNISIYGLILIGYLVEKNYVGRVAIFANSLALISFFLQRRDLLNLDSIIPTYVDFGLLWGVIAIYKYSRRKDFDYEPLPNWFYNIGWLYSSVVVGLVLLYFQLAYPV